MSELKEHQFCECDEIIREYRGQLSNEMRPYYLKSEADKVIAELEENHKKEVEQLLIEIAELKSDYKEACDRLQTANLIKNEQLAAARHHKYKRCLAMAVICFNRAERANCWKEEVKSRKRFEKWLELSKKFKQGLVIGVDKATGTDKTVSINYKEAK